MEENILEVQNLKKFFPIRKGFLLRHIGDVKAVDDVSFQLRRGETLGLVGESGCGKSTLGRTIIRLYDPSAGVVKFNGVDFAGLSGQRLRHARRDIQMIFQDPYASLDPRMTVGQIIAQPLIIHKFGTRSEIQQKIEDLLQRVGLKRAHLNRYPHEFSGGQRQRISIARAIALEPKLIIADEPVSALDVSIQAQILNLMKDLQEQMGLTYLFISHDLSVVKHMSDRVAVMYLGRIVELAEKNQLFSHPGHPYTQALLRSIPRLAGDGARRAEPLKGEVPSPITPPSGCAFHPRCAYASEICTQQTPALEANTVGSPARVACWNTGAIPSFGSSPCQR